MTTVTGEADERVYAAISDKDLRVRVTVRHTIHFHDMGPDDLCRECGEPRMKWPEEPK